MSEVKVYERPKSWMPNVSSHYCPGCGHGIAHRLVCEAIAELGIQNDTIGVAPVGCAAMIYDYMDTDYCEAPHGRAPAVATGLKTVRPDKIVYTYQGDGDLASIGMGEIIHAANRGQNITVIFINNAMRQPRCLARRPQPPRPGAVWPRPGSRWMSAGYWTRLTVWRTCRVRRRSTRSTSCGRGEPWKRHSRRNWTAWASRWWKS